MDGMYFSVVFGRRYGWDVFLGRLQAPVRIDWIARRLGTPVWWTGDSLLPRTLAHTAPSPALPSQTLALQQLWIASSLSFIPDTHFSSSLPMSDKHAVIRVSSIPLKTTVAALHSALPFPVPSQSHTTLCTFPYSSSLTAVVHLPGPVPKPLESLGHGEAYKAKIGPTGHPITIDRDFYGLTQLYETRGTIHAEYRPWTSMIPQSEANSFPCQHRSGM